MKALIIGIDSTIGRALANSVSDIGWQVYGTSRRAASSNAKIFQVDLGHDESINNIQGSFDVVYACAAMPNMDMCENNPELSYQINVRSQISLAKHCIPKTANYVFLSTTAVFDGSKPKPTVESITTAKCIYGLHKAMAETALLNLSPHITIVRTSKVISKDYKLITNWINNLEQNLIIEPFYDLNLSPVPMHKLLELLQKIAERPSHNILHISGKDDIPYSELALMLAKALKKSSDLIKAKSYLSAGLTKNMTFPFSSLDMSQTTAAYGLLPAGIDEILNLVLQGQQCVSN